MLAAACLRMTRGSISVPARKVRRMAPNPARKFTQSVSARGSRFPATAPTTISINATEIATRMDMIAATKAKPNHNADASRTFSKAHLFVNRFAWPDALAPWPLGPVTSDTASGERDRERAIAEILLPQHPIGRSHQPCGGFGEPHPHRTK